MIVIEFYWSIMNQFLPSQLLLQILKKETIPLLAELLEVEDSIITHRVNEAQKYSWYRTSPLLKDVNFNSFTNVQENLWRLSGIGHEIGSKRNYPSKVNASHIFGYLRELTKRI